MVGGTTPAAALCVLEWVRAEHIRFVSSSHSVRLYASQSNAYTTSDFYRCCWPDNIGTSETLQHFEDYIFPTSVGSYHFFFLAVVAGSTYAAMGYLWSRVLRKNWRWDSGWNLSTLGDTGSPRYGAVKQPAWSLFLSIRQMQLWRIIT
jgi:hypothetical protein